MGEENGFNKYTPQHPLPQTIQKMTRDDTVCQYCGVSYLIHNEIKKLEEKLAECIGELDQQRKWKDEKKEKEERIKSLEASIAQVTEELKEEKRSKTTLEQLAVSKEKELIIAYDKASDLEKCLKKEQANIQILKQTLGNFQPLLISVSNAHVDLKRQMKLARESIGEMANVRMEYIAQVLVTIKDLTKAKEHERVEMEREIMAITKQNEVFSLDSRNKDTELSKLKKENSDLLIKIDELTSLKAEFLNCKKAMSELESANKELENQLQKIAHHLRLKEDLTENLSTELREERNKTEHSITLYQKQLQEKEEQLKNITNTCKQLEHKLFVFEQDGSQTQKKLMETENEKKGLSGLISALKLEVKDLKTERAQMIEAHQNRIHQLRESFFEKLKEADAWPDRLKDELTQQEKKSKEEMARMKRTMEEAHQKEMKDFEYKLREERERSNEEKKTAVKKLQSQLLDAETRWRSEQKKADDTLKKEQESSASIIKDQVAMIGQLKDKVRSLEDKVKGCSQEENLEAYRIKCAESESALKLSNSELTQMEQELGDTKRELFSLQETVRRECEERLELTEALAQARSQLLVYMRTGSSLNLRGNDHKALLANQALSPSPTRPQAVTKAQSPNNRVKDSKYSGINITHSDSENESRRRIAAAIQKVRSSSRTSLYEDGGR